MDHHTPEAHRVVEAQPLKALPDHGVAVSAATARVGNSSRRKIVDVLPEMEGGEQPRRTWSELLQVVRDEGLQLPSMGSFWDLVSDFYDSEDPIEIRRAFACHEAMVLLARTSGGQRGSQYAVTLCNSLSLLMHKVHKVGLFRDDLYTRLGGSFPEDVAQEILREARALSEEAHIQIQAPSAIRDLPRSRDHSPFRLPSADVLSAENPEAVRALRRAMAQRASEAVPGVSEK